MTTAKIRQRLLNYLEEADDKKVKAIYTLLEKDIEEESFVLSDEQLQILDKQRELYLSKQTITLNRAEALSFIRGE